MEPGQSCRILFILNKGRGAIPYIPVNLRAALIQNGEPFFFIQPSFVHSFSFIFDCYGDPSAIVLIFTYPFNPLSLVFILIFVLNEYFFVIIRSCCSPFDHISAISASLCYAMMANGIECAFLQLC
jgi:hypothetical protein